MNKARKPGLAILPLHVSGSDCRGALRTVCFSAAWLTCLGCLSLDPPLPVDAPDAGSRPAPVHDRPDAAPRPALRRGNDGGLPQEPIPQAEAAAPGPVLLNSGQQNPALAEEFDFPIEYKNWSHVEAPRMVDIGVGASGVAWAVSSTPHPLGGGNRIYRLGEPNPVGGSGTRIAVAPDGRVWVVNDAREIYQLGNGQWTRASGCAQDIGAGNERAAWFVGCDPHPLGGGQRIYRIEDPKPALGSAVRIAVSPAGSPWVVNAYGKIYRWREGEWLEVPGCANDIGVGGNDATWIIGCDPAPGGFGIWAFRPRSLDAGVTDSWWSRVDGAGLAIAVDAQGRPWIVDDKGRVYRRTE